jgi:hypothetical protein
MGSSRRTRYRFSSCYTLSQTVRYSDTLLQIRKREEPSLSLLRITDALIKSMTCILPRLLNACPESNRPDRKFRNQGGADESISVSISCPSVCYHRHQHFNASCLAVRRSFMSQGPSLDGWGFQAYRGSPHPTIDRASIQESPPSAQGPQGCDIDSS